MTFDLRAAVADVSADLTDIDEIASKVAENVPSRELRATLTEALRPYVREFITRRRATNPVLAPASAAAVRPARSDKVARIRAMGRAWLRENIHVGDGERKQLADCTYQDLMFAAEERRENARRNLAKADRFEEIANMLNDRGVSTVAELPTEDLQGWSEAA